MSRNPHAINDPDISDAEIVADWSIDAVRAGRVQLAEALLRIAAQAVRSTARTPRADGAQAVPVVPGPAMVDVPIYGATREELPNRRLRTAPDTTEVMDVPTGLDRRCTAQVLKGNVYSECHGAAYWVHGQIGDASTPAVQARWEHVDDQLNADHAAYVQA